MRRAVTTVTKQTSTTRYPASPCMSSRKFLFHDLIVHRSDSTQSCELDLLTADSMPPPPRLYNIDRSLGPIVKFYVLGYAMTNNALIKWADNKHIAPDKTSNNRRHLTWRAICKKLPESCRPWATVTLENGSIANCVVLAANDSMEEVKRADNLGVIRAVQKVVQVSPKWYKVAMCV